MKVPIAVSLIVGGTFIVAIPPLSDAWHAFLTAQILQHAAGTQSVNLEGGMPDLYRFGCWVLGAAMIGVSIFTSLPIAATGSDRSAASIAV